MTIENEVTQEPKDDGVAFNDALAAIERSVSEKIDRSMSDLSSKIEATSRKPEPTYEPEDYDEDAPLSRKEVADMVRREAEELNKKNRISMEARSRKQAMDSKAMSEFPELQERLPNGAPNPAYSRKLYDEVSKEITARVKMGRSGEDADLVYDCSTAVANRGIREGWYSPRAKVERDNVSRNSHEDNFSVSGTPSRSSAVPTEDQVKFGMRMGLTKEKLSQMFERRAKR